MRRLNLDFQSKPATTGSSGLILLVIALLLGGKLYTDYQGVADLVERGESRLARLERIAGYKNGRAGSQDTAPLHAEMKHANKIIEQLTLPWDQLFASIENATGKDVALLSIQPDRNKSIVAIGGEAKNVAAMLDYMRRLGEENPLSDVVLLSHQIQQEDPQKPVRFTLSAKWIPE